MNTKAKKKSRKAWWIVLALLTAMIAAGGWFRHKKRSESMEKIVTYKVEEKALASILYLTGRVRPKSSMVITPASSGHVVEILVDEGAVVKKGDPLFSMRLEMQGQDDLLRLRSEVKQLELEAAALRQKVDEKNAVSSLIAGTVLLDERNALEKTLGQLSTARERLAVVEQDLGLHAPEKKAARPGGKSGERSVVTIHAPADGIITLVDKQPGDFVSGGNRSLTTEDGTVMILADMSVLQVRTKVLESDLRQISFGQPVSVRLDAYPQELYDGEVSHIGGQGRIEKTAGYTYFDVDVTLKGGNGQVLPEMNASVEITLDERQKTKVLPLAAVALYADRAFVLGAAEKGNEEQIYTQVEVGIKNEKEAEILSGLDVGQEVLEIDFAKLPVNPDELKVHDRKSPEKGQESGASERPTVEGEQKGVKKS